LSQAERQVDQAALLANLSLLPSVPSSSGVNSSRRGQDACSNAESAQVPPEKLSDYLLNPSHPVGGSKARWFIALGYHPESPDQLAADLVEVLRGSADITETTTPYGVKYAVRGRLKAPNGNIPEVVTVWIVETDAAEPRLVTAYPDARDDS
jgi:hypothetical protein